MASPSADGLKVTAVSNEGLVCDNRKTKNGKFTMAQLRQTDGIVPLQYGTNQFDSQKGKTGFGMPRHTATKVDFADDGKRWNIEEGKDSDGIVRLQSGTNQFDSQKGMVGFGTIRNTTYVAESGKLPYEDMKKSESIIPSQAGWNKGDSQKGMDVKGKHLKRIWELEFPEEAVADITKNQ